MKNFFEKLNYIWILRIIAIVLVAGVALANISLPKESDAYFELNKEKDGFELQDILFKGDFERVMPDGQRVPVDIPGNADVPKGELFVIESVIPEDYDEAYIITRSAHQEMKIYIGDELRVYYTTENSRPLGTESPNRYVFCPTSREDAGKVVRIETVSRVRNYSGTTNFVYSCNKYDFWTFTFKQYGSDLVFGMIILLLGLFVIGTSLAIEIGYKRQFELEYIGWCVTYVGMWLVCDSKLRQLIISNVSSIANITFLVIILAPLPLSLSVDTMQKRRYHKYFKVLNTVVWANLIIATILELTKIANYIDLLTVAHVILVAAFVLVFVTLIHDWKTGNIAEYKSIVMGLVMLIISVTIEIVAVYFVDILSGVVLTIGTVIYICTAFVKTISDIRREEAVKQYKRLKEQKKQSELVSMQMIRTLSDTLEAKDVYTRGHSRRVADYAVILAKELGMDEEELSKLHYAASLHDIGKIGVPDTILNKPSRLTNEEYAIIKTHTVIGADILKKIDIISYVEDVARYHHERYDGKGYPEGLSGENIPYEARIVALADSFDAMNSKRIYRRPVPNDVIREEIVKNKGTQFDPDMAEVFLKLFDEGAFEIEEKNLEFEDVAGANDDANEIIALVADAISTKTGGEDMDFLTGLPMRNRGEKLIREKMEQSNGYLLFVDMDNLKVINDTYGHQAGDNVLRVVGETITAATEDSVACRIGGDEFLVYAPADNDEQIKAVAERIIKTFDENKAVDFQMADASLSIGISVAKAGELFDTVFSRADKALYYVKHMGKAGAHIYNDETNFADGKGTHVDMDKLVNAIRNSGKYDGAMALENRGFAKMYGYIANLCERYDYNCQIVLITNEVKAKETVSMDAIEKSMEYMEIAIRDTIRNVDVCTRHSSVQFLVILLEAGEENVDVIVNRIFSSFHKMFNENWLIPTYETKSMKADAKKED